MRKFRWLRKAKLNNSIKAGRQNGSEEMGMGWFDVDEEKLQALIQYARENHCTYDQAWLLVKTGKRM